MTVEQSSSSEPKRGEMKLFNMDLLSLPLTTQHFPLDEMYSMYEKEQIRIDDILTKLSDHLSYVVQYFP